MNAALRSSVERVKLAVPAPPSARVVVAPAPAIDQVGPAQRPAEPPAIVARGLAEQAAGLAAAARPDVSRSLSLLPDGTYRIACDAANVGVRAGSAHQRAKVAIAVLEQVNGKAKITIRHEGWQSERATIDLAPDGTFDGRATTGERQDRTLAARGVVRYDGERLFLDGTMTFSLHPQTYAQGGRFFGSSSQHTFSGRALAAFGGGGDAGVVVDARRLPGVSLHRDPETQRLYLLDREQLGDVPVFFDDAGLARAELRFGTQGVRSVWATLKDGRLTVSRGNKPDARVYYQFNHPSSSTVTAAVVVP